MIGLVVAAALASTPRLAVVPIGVDDGVRATLESAAAGRSDVVTADRAAVDAALAALRGAGLECSADDDACLVKLGLEGDFDLVLVVSRVGSITVIHLVDVGSGHDRGSVPLGADAALAVARALRGSPPPAPPSPTVAASTPAPRDAAPAPKQQQAPPSSRAAQTSTAAGTRAVPSVTAAGVSFEHLALGGAAALGVITALSLGAAAAAIDVSLSDSLVAARDQNIAVDVAAFKRDEDTQNALIAGAAVAGVVGAGALTLFFVLE